MIIQNFMEVKMNNIQMGLLGPDGTFTSQAGYDYIKRRGIEPQVRWYDSIEQCFDGVDDNEVTHAIVPILNSTSRAAWVNETLEHLRNNSVVIYDEQILPIRHNLAAIPGTKLSQVRFVYSKDNALQQCAKHLAEIVSVAELKDMSSTAAAGEHIKKLGSPNYAAVVPMRAVELYGLEVLAQDIQDNPHNKTRFIVISKHDHEPTGKDKTTAIFEFKHVEDPGLLCDLLEELKKRNISLCYIQSIPKEGELTDFTFYVDIMAHRKDSDMAEALREIEKKDYLSYWRVLGSYPIFT